MRKALNVAIVGYGMAGRTFHAPLIATTPGMLLQTVVSSDAEKVKRDFPAVKVVSDLAMALADPAVDLVVIATPDELHARQAHAALDAGKHVVVDKPFALSLEEARGVVQHAADANLFLSVFQNRRWDSDFLTVRHLIENGTLGEVFQFESHFDRFRPVMLDRWKDRRSSGVWQDLGPHLVDQALQLFGPPIGIYADLARQRPQAAAIDYFHVLLRYPRLRVILHASQMTPNSDLRFAVHGSLGTFIKYGTDPQEAALAAGNRPGADGWGSDRRHGSLTSVTDETETASSEYQSLAGNYPAYYASVRDAIQLGSPNPVSPKDALLVMKIFEAGLESAHTGREVLLRCGGPPRSIGTGTRRGNLVG
jgi:predicted dehydrogenase